MSKDTDGDSGTEAEEVAWTCRVPTADELATHALATTTGEQTVPLANDFLQKMVTLLAALVGGGFIIAKGDTLPLWSGSLALTILLTSLGFAIHGLRPMRIDMDIREFGGLDRFNRFKLEVVGKKEFAIRWTTRFLFLGFLIGILGFICKGLAEGSKPTEVIIERTGKPINPFEHIVDNAR